MRAVHIEESLMAEVCEAANFEQKTCDEYINAALREALRWTQKRRDEPEAIKKFIESYEQFPQELETSEEEWEHWRKAYEKFERGDK